MTGKGGLISRKKRAKKKQGLLNMNYELRKAMEETERNKQLIEVGETFRPMKRIRPEKVPSHYKARY